MRAFAVFAALVALTVLVPAAGVVLMVGLAGWMYRQRERVR